MRRFELLLSTEAEPSFRFIDPPFALNSPKVSVYGTEVTGYRVLKSLCRRVGWESLVGRKLLDFGCGVRFTRTIVNLGLDIGRYVGVDVNADVVEWLRSNVIDDRFRFERIDMKNLMYNPDGSTIPMTVLTDLALSGFDAACMYSVITHQAPEDAKTIMQMLSRCVVAKGVLYFTAFVNDAIDGYIEGNPARRCERSTYNPDFLINLVEECGWIVQKFYPGDVIQQPAFVCRRRD